MNMQRLTLVIATTMMLSLSSSVLAGTIQIDVQPADVPDESLPRVNSGDAPAGYGPDSWQGPVAGIGNKTNWHARYLADGDALSTLFPADAATMTIADLASISYSTKRPTGTGAGEDWYILMYTRPTGVGDNAGWYHDRFISNYSANTSLDVWTQYSTDTGMTFSSNGLGVIGESTLAQLIAAAGTQEIEMISVQTASNWDGFDGYMDGLEIELINGNVGQVNFVPEPSTLALAGLGLALLGYYGLRRRRRQRN